MNLFVPHPLFPRRSARTYIFVPTKKDVQAQERVVSRRLTASSAFFIIHRDFCPKHAIYIHKQASFVSDPADDHHHHQTVNITAHRDQHHQLSINLAHRLTVLIHHAHIHRSS
ncbi:hypothetical protein K443DRAFT_596802 [Laccaria amethystina LaAM-08-1]|uniref:Uncharacterized protein n=1 Tax=Laccaria amethystina LaAM-08-1 TaxID=1095629 RepID=A0A0C9XGP7_9AGAR|nr:hypothetical protein K443DRAFT_596802 [Laccaria amethystina LaAM-08-1]